MNAIFIWWALAGITLVVEITTGTLYLLMLAIGFVCSAIAAHLGASIATQVWVFSIVASVALSACWWLQHRHRKKRVFDDAMGLDIGQRLRIDEWAADGTAQVQYRGATWQAQPRPGEPAVAGEYRIAEISGNRLLLEKVQL